MIIRDFLKVSTKGGAIVAFSVIIQTTISIVTQIILARLLAPEIFGTIAFAITTAMFLNAFTNLRGDTFVIHQNDSPHHTLDVVFTLELISATFFYIVIFLSAPFLMNFLGKSSLTLYVQLIALSFFYNPLSRPRCLFERNLSFFKSKFPFLFSQLFAAASSIIIAAKGYGIWSLLWWRLSALFGEIIILWIIASYRPTLRWDLDTARKFIGFTYPLIGSAILSFFCYNVDYFIVGQFLENGVTELGYYWLGFQAAAYFLIARQILYEVLFPIFSQFTDMKFKTEAFLRFSNAMASIFMILTIGAIIFGRDIIIFIYGNTWEPAVFPFQIIFIVVLLRAIASNSGYYLYSLGKTRPEFICVILFSLLLAPSAYFCTMHYGINGTAVSVLAVQTIVTLFIYNWYIKPLTGHGFMHFFIWPIILSALTLTSTIVTHELGLSFFFRLIFFILFITLTYFTIVRFTIQDLRTAISILKNKPPFGSSV